MVERAAVKIKLLTNFYDWATNPGEIIIPCHRHADAYEILNLFHYRDGKEYRVIAEGFLDEHNNFMSRVEAWKEAKRCNQFLPCYIEACDDPDVQGVLYSEDVW